MANENATEPVEISFPILCFNETEHTVRGYWDNLSLTTCNAPGLDWYQSTLVIDSDLKARKVEQAKVIGKGRWTFAFGRLHRLSLSFGEYNQMTIGDVRDLTLKYLDDDSLDASRPDFEELIERIRVAKNLDSIIRLLEPRSI